MHKGSNTMRNLSIWTTLSWGRFWLPLYTTKGSYSRPKMHGKWHETERSTPKSIAGRLRVRLLDSNRS